LKNEALKGEYQVTRVTEDGRDKVRVRWDATDSETVEYSIASWAFIHFLRAYKKDPQKWEAMAAQIELVPEGETPEEKADEAK
jgi:hypothetical protein